MRYLMLLLMLVAVKLHALAPLPLEDAKPVQSVKDAQHAYVVALGKPRKVNDRWQFENNKVVEALRERSTWQLASGKYYLDTVKLYKTWVQESGAEVLYHCAGRECGSSNVWANEYFNDRRLYGPDAGQYYWVLQQAQTLWIVYLIERGNKNVFLHVETLQLAAAKSAANLLTQDCETAALKPLMDAQKQWLLLASVPSDEHQAVSIRLGLQCARAIERAYPHVVITVMGLGRFTKAWQLAPAIAFELVPAP